VLVRRSILVATVASAFGVACRGKPAKVAGGSAPVPAVVTPGADWRTYRNDQLGFQLRYPSNWAETTATRGPERMPFIAFIPPASDTGTGKAGVTVTLTSTERALKACAAPGSRERSINGVKFLEADFAGGAPHTTYFQHSFHTLREGACYEIALYAIGGPALAGTEFLRSFPVTSEAVLGTFQFVPKLPADAGEASADGGPKP
jgi:hypothetical protein